MITGEDFIITSLQPWDIRIGSTIKNTAQEISRKNRVLYINAPMNYLEWIKTTPYCKQEQLRQINDNLWVVDLPFPVIPINKIPGMRLFDIINKINNKKIAGGILKAAHKLGFHKFIHLIDTDIYRSQYLKELLQPELSIYYCRDFVIGADYWKKNGPRLEPLIAAKSDIVLTNSSLFAERFRKYNPNTYAIETGVNLQLYDYKISRDIPEDIKNISRPIVGYTGMVIGLRLDIELIYQVASRMSGVQFVFVGPTDDTFEKHSLCQLTNVHFLGGKPVDALPAYIQAFDVCMNPQAINEITMGNYPLKIDEYLAMGKPTVATRTHTMTDIFDSYVTLASGTEEYIQAINHALTESENDRNREKRIAFAHTHSWTNSVNKIYKAIEETREMK